MFNFFNAQAPAPVDPTAVKPAASNNDTYRLALAKALMQSGAEPIQDQKAGGMVTPTSPWEVLGKLGQSAVGAYMMGK